MDFAIIEDGTVTNVIVGPLPNGMDGIPLNGRPVAIGDAYADGAFTRGGEPVLTDAEKIIILNTRVAELEAQING
jgi:hypothetical protein